MTYSIRVDCACWHPDPRKEAWLTTSGQWSRWRPGVTAEFLTAAEAHTFVALNTRMQPGGYIVTEHDDGIPVQPKVHPRVQQEIAAGHRDDDTKVQTTKDKHGRLRPPGWERTRG